MHHIWAPLDDGIGCMRVDPWTLENCIHIPEPVWADFARCSGGAHLLPGDSREVQLDLAGVAYKARLYFMDRAEPNRGELELRYDHNHELQHVLNTRFKTSAEWIFQARIGKPLGMSVTVPDALAEYLEFYATGQPYHYRLECRTQDERPHRSDPVPGGILQEKPKPPEDVGFQLP